ncbi:hypothetical protein P4K63_00605 [Bacillus cereus]|nr:hypothetical protein [Bacillus cereus]
MKIETLKRDIRDNFTESSFSNCSYDDNNDVVLINSEMGTFDFDEICSEIVGEMEGNCITPTSLDSLFIQVNGISFIEFKNTLWGRIKKRDLRNKIYDSLALIISRYDLSKSDLSNVKIYLIHKTDEDKTPTHQFTNGTCPREFRYIQETSGVKIMKYDAQTFEKYITSHNKLPEK